MNTTKTIICAGLVMYTLATISSCIKKSKDDPLISLRTRNNRIAGEWKLVTKEFEYNSNYSNSKGEIHNIKTTEKFDGTNLTITDDRNDNTLTCCDQNGNYFLKQQVTYTATVSVYSMILTIKKDGISSCTTSKTQNSPVPAATIESTGTGFWGWIGTDKINLEAECVSGKVTRLSNKELVIERINSEETSGGDYIVKTTNTEKFIFEKQ